mmetsp:Transcript_10784/g.16399  ORF Transcript_10784/g.16399 Transcript_10784/m.16399 type:complete len:439 (-) Transcript_10784:26-1342(-)
MVSMLVYYITVLSVLVAHNKQYTALSEDIYNFEMKVEDKLLQFEVDGDAKLSHYLYSLVIEHKQSYSGCKNQTICSIILFMKTLQQKRWNTPWSHQTRDPLTSCFSVDQHNMQSLDRFRPFNSSSDFLFIPESISESLISVYTMWNILDQLMRKQPEAYMFGYLRPVQLVDMLRTIDSINASTYCEIGFNAGHSAAAILTARPHMKVYSFDIVEHAYTLPAAEFLKDIYGNNFEFIPGRSQETVVKRAYDDLYGACDIMFIDGSHTEQDVLDDILNFRLLASPKHVVYLDDTTCVDWDCFVAGYQSGWCDINTASSFSAATVRYVANDLTTVDVIRWRDGMQVGSSRGVLVDLEITDYECGHPCNPPVRTHDDESKMPTRSLPWSWARTRYNPELLISTGGRGDLFVNRLPMETMLDPDYLLFWEPRVINISAAFVEW